MRQTLQTRDYARRELDLARQKAGEAACGHSDFQLHGRRDSQMRQKALPPYCAFAEFSSLMW